MSSSEENSSNIVEGWVDEIIENESTIRGFLDGIISDRLDSCDDVRERLRGFAEESKYNQAFSGLYFSLVQQEEFFEDVEEEYDTATREKLEELGQEYSELSEDFKLVYEEEFYSKHNPISTQKADVVALTGKENIPVISYRAYSGSKLAFRSDDSMEKHLNHIAAMVNYTTKSFENYADSYSEDRLKEITKERNHIEDHLEELNEILEKFDIEIEEEEEEDYHKNDDS